MPEHSAARSYRGFGNDPSRRRPARGASSPSSSYDRGSRSGRPARPSQPRRHTPPPIQTREPRPAVTSFAEAGLPDSLIRALSRRGIEAPFAIQSSALPDALAGEHVLGRAQTGAGKTLAFGLPLLARLAELSSTGSRVRPSHPRGLVLVPTRELAQQVADALGPLGAAIGVRLTTVYGGQSMSRQISALRRGVDLVVATPGRLTDLIERDACSLDEVVISVLDEADHMCDLGFLPAVQALLAQVPSEGQRMLFSATLDGGVDVLVRTYLPEPVLVAVDPEVSSIVTMEHAALEAADQAAKLRLVTTLAGGSGRTLLFARTQHGTDRLALQLTRAGIPAGALHGGLSQNARTRALKAFSDGTSRVLVATDVAARGIHVDDIDLVVHADPPTEPKAYLHRSGRTARAGAGGAVVTVSVPDQRRAVESLLRAAGVDARPQPVDEFAEVVTRLAGPPAPRIIPTATTFRPETDRRPSYNGGGSDRRSSSFGRGRDGGSRDGRGYAGGRGDASGRPPRRRPTDRTSAA